MFDQERVVRVHNLTFRVIDIRHTQQSNPETTFGQSIQDSVCQVFLEDRLGVDSRTTATVRDHFELVRLCEQRALGLAEIQAQWREWAYVGLAPESPTGTNTDVERCLPGFRVFVA